MSLDPKRTDVGEKGPFHGHRTTPASNALRHTDLRAAVQDASRFSSKWLGGGGGGNDGDQQ